MKLDRRGLIKALVGIPVIGGLIAILSPLFRFLKPNDKPWKIFTVAPDTPAGGPQIVGRVSALQKPFDSFYFTYVQKYVQYDPTGFEAANIPGVAIRLPKKVKFANLQGYVGYDGGETDIVLYSRICPHLGCIFDYVPVWQNVTSGYGGFTPPGWEQHALMACPCHFSIYDPEYPGDPGNVISGPAPRGARYFHFKIQGDDIIVNGAELGGIAEDGPENRPADGRQA
jgi:arsenite oxidase small subunit